MAAKDMTMSDTTNAGELAVSKVPPILLHFFQGNISAWSRPYVVPFARVRTFEDFQEVANELATDDVFCHPSEGAPAPEKRTWQVLDESGAIVKDRFWSDLIMPGAKLYLAPDLMLDGLYATAVTQQQTVQQTDETRIQKVDEPHQQQDSKVTGALTLVSGNTDTTYADDYNKNNIHPSHQALQKYPTTYQSRGRGGGRGAGQFGPPRKTYAQVCHDHVQQQHALQQQQQQLPQQQQKPKVYGESLVGGPNAGIQSEHNNANNNTNTVGTSNNGYAGSSWNGVSKKRAFGTAIKVTLRDTGCNFVSTTTLSKHSSVDELIKKLGGAPGARIQVLRHTEGGFLLGQSFMSGTRKSLDEAGFGQEGNIHVVLFQPEPGRRLYSSSGATGAAAGGTQSSQ